MLMLIVAYLSVDQAEENDYRKPARSGAVDQAEGKGKEEGAVFSAGANWVCTGALTQSSAATARSIAPDAAARVDAASASLQEHESSQLPSQLLSQDSSQLVLQSALSVSGSPSHS